MVMKGNGMEKNGNKEIEIKETEKESGKKSAGKNGRLKAAAIIIILAAVAGSLFYFSQKPQNSLSSYQLSFANETLNFRANLEKAAAVPAIPDDVSVRNAILSGNVSRISLSYVPDEKYNGFYAVDGFEITYKLLIIFKHYYGINGYVYAGENGENCMFFEETSRTICISHAPVSSESDIISSSSEPVIFMSASNETSVSLKNNTIYLKGTPEYVQNSGNKYTGLDMATDKFLMALMGK